MMARLRALIIGAGVGGLATAVALRRAGVEAAIFERGRTLEQIQVGGGFYLQHNAIAALRQLDLADQVCAAGKRIAHNEFRTWRGRNLGYWPAAELEREAGAPAIGINRMDLHPVLAGAVDATIIHLGRECTGFRQDAEGVTARFADGGEERGDLLIAADGINSAIRTQLHGKSAPRYAGYTLWQGIVDLAPPVVPDDTFRELWGRGERFTFYPVRQGLYWAAIHNAREGGTTAAGEKRAALLARFRHWETPTATILEHAAEETISRLDVRDRAPLKHWGEGRVTLLGDAAHAMTFNLGQGACQSIEDAVALGKCLAPRGDRDVAAALRAYEARRIGRTTSMVNLARQMGRIGQMENPALCAVRNGILQVFYKTLAWRQQKRDMAYQV